MKNLTQEEISQRAIAINELIGQEKRLKEELLSLRIYGEPDNVERMLLRQDEILKEIDAIRFERMIPILKEISDFIVAPSAL